MKSQDMKMTQTSKIGKSLKIKFDTKIHTTTLITMSSQPDYSRVILYC